MKSTYKKISNLICFIFGITSIIEFFEIDQFCDMFGILSFIYTAMNRGYGYGGYGGHRYGYSMPKSTPLP